MCAKHKSLHIPNKTPGLSTFNELDNHYKTNTLREKILKSADLTVIKLITTSTPETTTTCWMEYLWLTQNNSELI